MRLSSHSRKPPPKHSDSSTPFPRADPNASEWSRPIADGRLPRDRARCSCKYTKAKPQPDGFLPPGDIVIPAFGYMNH